MLIEAELKKDDPAANVIKIWSWARAQKTTTPILFVHGFSKLYATQKIRLRERANFVGERMAEAALNINYVPTDINYRNKNGRLVHYKPKTGPGFSAMAGAGRLRDAARGLAKEIARLEKESRSKQKEALNDVRADRGQIAWSIPSVLLPFQPSEHIPPIKAQIKP